MKRLTKLAVVATGAILALSVTSAPASALSGNDLPALAARDYAKTQWPDEYAGFWVSYVTQPTFDDGLPADARFHFGFTDEAEAKVEILRDMFPGIHDYIAAEHEFSMNHLFEVHAAAVADLRQIGEGTLDAPGNPVTYWSVGIADDKNRTMVGVPEANATPEFKAWALDRWGPAAQVSAEMPIYPAVLPRPGGGPAVGGDDRREDVAKPTPKPTLKKQKALVKKCNRAAKSRSSARKRFSKSKKCKRARRAVRASTS